MAGIRQTPNSNVQSTTVTYPSQATGSTPQLQIINSPGGGKGQVQFHSDNGSFAGDSNFIWNNKTRTMSVLGNIRISENIIGKYYTNLTNFKITGGNSGQVLSTNGSGNLSWADQISPANYGNSNVANYLPTYTGNVSANYFIGNGSQLTGLPTQYSNSNVANYLPTYTGNVSANYFIGNGSQLTGLPTQYSNSNVANYLPTYTGNLNGSNLIISNTGYIYNISSTGSASLTTANVSANLTANAIYTDNYFYANGSPYSGGGSELVNGNNSFVLDVDGNVVFEGDIAGQAIDRGLVWDYGANANGVNSTISQDGSGLTVRAYTEDSGNISASVNIVTNQDANAMFWEFDGYGNLTLPGNLIVPTGNIVSDTLSSPFSSAITGITTGNATVIVAIADSVFPDPYSGTVTISGVTGTTEANDVWGYETVEVNAFQLYTDATLTTPVDGTTWTPYVSGGTAVGVGLYSNLTIQGGNVSIGSNDSTWVFDTNGNLTVPGTIKSAQPLVYRGWYATLNQIYGASDPTINQIVLSQSSSITGSNESADTNNDDFTVTGLTESNRTAVITLYSEEDAVPIVLSDVRNFIETYIDLVLYDGETLRNSVSSIQTAFAANETALIESVPPLTLNTSFNFNAIQSIFSLTGFANTGTGTGAAFYFNYDNDPGGTVNYYSLSATLMVPGSGYTVLDEITVPGAEFNGTSPANDMIITVQEVDGDGGIVGWGVSGSMTLATYEQCFARYFINDGDGDAYDLGNYVGTDYSECTFTATSNADDELVVTAVTKGALLPFMTFYEPVGDTWVMILWQKSGATEGGPGTYICRSLDESNLPSATYTANGIQYAINDVITASSDWNGGEYGSMVSTTAGIWSMVALSEETSINSFSYLGETGADGSGEKTAYSKFALGTAPLTLEAGYNIWTFNPDGNLTLAGGNSVIQSIANSSLDPENSNVSIMVFTPDALYSSQSLVLDPTGPSHIHLRSPGLNIDEPDANIFLGGEDSSFEVGYYNGAAPNLFVHSGGNTWTFGTDGNLILPTGTPSINYANGSPYGGGGANTGNVTFSGEAVIGTGTSNTQSGLYLAPDPASLANSLYLRVRGNIQDEPTHIHFDTGNNQYYNQFIGDDNKYVQLANTGNIVINTSDYASNTAQWTFDTAGNLTLPEGTTIGDTSEIVTVTLDQFTDGGYPGTQVFNKVSDTLYELSPGGPYMTLISGIWRLKISTATYYDSTDLITWGTIAGGLPTPVGTLTTLAIMNLGVGGNVWAFGGDGNLYLPDTTSVLANVSIRLEANDTGNITGLSVIGDSHANLYAHGNVTIVSDSSNTTPTWTFGTDGSLTLPSDSSILTNETALNIATHSTATYTFNQAYWEALNGDVTRMFTPTGDAQYFSCTVTANQDGTYTVADPTGNSFDPGSWFKIPGNQLGGATPANDIQITVATVDIDGVILTTTVTGAAVGKQWTFGEDGIITVPGPISGLGYSKLDFTTYGSNTVYLTTTNDDSTALFMGAVSADLYAHTNVSIRTNTVGTSQEWIFDDAGNLTLPGNTFAVNYANGTQVSISGGSSSSSNISNGNSNVSIATANGNVTINAVGNNVVTITGTGANITGTANITGNVTPGNITFSSNTGQIVFGTGAFISGNANSLTRDGSILLQPYTGAGSTFPGVIIGGAGRLLAPNGGVFQIFNASDVTFQVAIKSTLSTAATSTTTGALIIPGGAGLAGSITTGIGALLTGPTFTPLANTMAGFVSNVNSYTQLTIQNKSTGADATTDFIATADNGTDTVNYADFGIINSGYDANTPTNSLGNIVFAADTYLYAQGNVSNTNQSGGNLAIGTTIAGKSVKIFAGGVTNNSIIATISNTGVAVNGNVTATNFSGNISITGNVIGTTPNVTLVAGSYSTVFANTGVATFPGNISTTGNFVGNGAALTNVAVSTTGTWTVATGINTYSITVPINGNYQLWVRGNIPNGIITYQATVSVTNTNVPVLGTQRAWNYTGGGSPILLTTMPTQIVGAEGTISTTVVSTTTANRFDFVINNSSGSSQTIYWGYVTL